VPFGDQHEDGFDGQQGVAEPGAQRELVLRVVHDQPEVEPAGGEQFELLLLRVAGVQGDLGPGQQAARGGHQYGGERAGDRAEPYGGQVGVVGAPLPYVTHEVLVGGEDAVRVRQHHRAERRGPRAVPVPYEQGGAQQPFYALELSGQRGLGEAEGRCGTADGAGVGDRVQDA
jgi:hypothetical protein